MEIEKLRKKYHEKICESIIRITKNKDIEYPNFADGSNASSRKIAWKMIELFGYKKSDEKVVGQTAGNLFEQFTMEYLRDAFNLLQHLRPGEWTYSIKEYISNFDQYKDLAIIEKIISENRSLSSMLGNDYIIKPDIIIGRLPVSDETINSYNQVISTNNYSKLTSLRLSNYEEPKPLLHASISCKWTIRSDRSQNTRTEALNLIRNRKGKVPHIIAVTAEPTPVRIASLALGTGDIDCVYHFALNELRQSIIELNNEDQMDMLVDLIEGRRLRDISDLPFDLAV